MNINTIIKRAKQAEIPNDTIAYILEMPLETINEIAERSGYNSRTKPNSMPDAYFIEALTNGHTVPMIAIELGCTRQSIYKLLKRRGISADAYR